jgi:hypothetical protein
MDGQLSFEEHVFFGPGHEEEEFGDFDDFDEYDELEDLEELEELEEFGDVEDLDLSEEEGLDDSEGEEDEFWTVDE